MSTQQNNIKKIYQHLKKCRDELKGVPTQREMADALKVSLTTVSNSLSILEAQGKITREPYKSRSIRIIEDATSSDYQDEIVEAIYKYIVDEIQAGHFPSQHEIADACFLSRTEVRRALLNLEAQERIIRVEGHRNIRLPE